MTKQDHVGRADVVGAASPGLVSAASAGDDPFVDVTLVDEMLRLTVSERLQLNDRMVRTALELRDAFERLRSARR